MLNKQLTGPNLSVTRRFGATLKKDIVALVTGISKLQRACS